MPKKRKNGDQKSWSNSCSSGLTCGVILAFVVAIVLLAITVGPEPLQLLSFNALNFLVPVAVTGVGGTCVCTLLDRCCHSLRRESEAQQSLLDHAHGENPRNGTEMQVQGPAHTVTMVAPKPTKPNAPMVFSSLAGEGSLTSVAVERAESPPSQTDLRASEHIPERSSYQYG